MKGCRERESWVWWTIIACAASALLAYGTGVAEAPARTGGPGGGRANQVPGIGPFSSEGGSMALLALGACLGAYNHSTSFQRLVFVSGAAFTFVYDTTDAYEPLGDLFPVDLLQTACLSFGFPDARWVTGQSVDSVKTLVKSQIDKGHPLIVSFLDRKDHRGFYVIAGYDFDSNVFYLQGGSRDSAYVAVPIPKGWDGPTASPAGWAENPVFTLGEFSPQGQESDNTIDRDAIALGMSLLEGGTVSYGTHPGEAPLMKTPGLREAAYGLPAYRLLSWDVANGDLVVNGEQGEEVNLDLIWRIDNLLRQVQSFRDNAGRSLNFVTSLSSPDRIVDVEALASNLQKTSTEASALRQIFWDMIPRNVTTPDSIAAYVKASRSMVLSFAGHDRFFQDLKDRGLMVFKTRSGPVIVADSPEKRLGAKLLARSLEARDRSSLAGMKEVVTYLAPAQETQEVRPSRRPHIRQGGGEAAKDSTEGAVREGVDVGTRKGNDKGVER